MERLTQWIDEERAITRVDLRNCGHEKCTTQLARYEDTGLTPDQIEGLKERMNDGWILVEERLPEAFGKYWATIRYNDGRISDPVVVDFRGATQNYVVDTPNGREYETWGIDSAFHGSRVIAWRKYYIPEPYRPERSNDEKE